MKPVANRRVPLGSTQPPTVGALCVVALLLIACGHKTSPASGAAAAEPSPLAATVAPVLAAAPATAATPVTAPVLAAAPATLLIGEFPLDAKSPVIDGDTIRVVGLDATLRLLGIDTEETFKKPEERALFARGWPQYLKHNKAQSPAPMKFATPLGTEATQFAEKFFAGVKVVRLERDHIQELRGRYGRHLAYVLVERDGRWVNYNVECVRAGMSPYFVKYSYSRRFHDEFVAAEAEARRAGRGVWKEGAMHYDDYPRRLAWWHARAKTIAAFEKEAAGRPELISLSWNDALDRLAQHVGKEVEVFGSVSDVSQRGRGPTRVTLAHRRGADFPLIFFDAAVLRASKLEGCAGEHVRVRGVVTRYHNKRANTDELQLVVKAAGQVSRPVGNPELDAQLVRFEQKSTATPAAGAANKAEPAATK